MKTYLNQHEFIGRSGKHYTFNILPLGEGIPALCVYVVISEFTMFYRAIYVGISDSVSPRFPEHYKMECFKKYHATHICFINEPDVWKRKDIEKDLIASLEPYCN